MRLFRDAQRRAKNASGRAQGYASCMRCGDSWAWKKHHDTSVDNSMGVFPVCEECWSILTDEEIVRYYGQLALDWGKPEKCAELIGAAMREKYPSAPQE